LEPNERYKNPTVRSLTGQLNIVSMKILRFSIEIAVYSAETARGPWLL